MATQADVRRMADADLMIRREPKKFFTEPHYAGFPAVLLRLAAVKTAELRQLMTDAHKARTG